ncbi:alpha/beta fold hydrolase [Streptomyces sp. 4N509B]|uniref:alpha/beta fold hydrolase n=1 Tax=Streptomyces sp. 4N509B TaxID=3457413 RepID=UPI003FCFE821
MAARAGRHSHAAARYVETVDGALAYCESGAGGGPDAGPPLVLLHGGFLDHGMWRDQISAFAPRHRVIAPDARGHGLSANATLPYRPADDLAVLLRALDAAPAVLVGLSMGGCVAVDTALEHPELVSALVVSGAGTSESPFEDPWTLDILDTQARALREGDVEGCLDAFLRLAAGPHRDLEDVPEEVVLRLRAMAGRTIAKHEAGTPDHVLPVTDTWRRAAALDVPVLAINGALDSPDHLSNAERLARTVRRGGVALVEDTAHYPPMEDPAAFNALLDDFLRGLPPSAAARPSP